MTTKITNTGRKANLEQVAMIVGPHYADEVETKISKLEQSETPCMGQECSGKLDVDMGDYLICNRCGGI